MNTPYLHPYRNGEYVQYMTDVLTLLDSHNVTALQLAEPHAALVAVIDKLNIAFKQSQGSELTPEIVALDDRRDRAIAGIKRITESYGYHYEPEIAAAGDLLCRNIIKHGDNIPRMSYQEQTAVLSSIVRDWEQEADLVAAVSILNLSGWLSELKQSNQQFTAMYLARVGETAHNTAVPIPKLREQGNEAYRNLVKHITAHATLSSNSTYNNLLNEIDVLAKQYNQIVDNRTNTTPNTEPPTEPNPDDTASEK